LSMFFFSMTYCNLFTWMLSIFILCYKPLVGGIPLYSILCNISVYTDITGLCKMINLSNYMHIQYSIEYIYIYIILLCSMTLYDVIIWCFIMLSMMLYRQMVQIYTWAANHTHFHRFRLPLPRLTAKADAPSEFRAVLVEKAQAETRKRQSENGVCPKTCSII
jgi:hypothetical protein